MKKIVPATLACIMILVLMTGCMKKTECAECHLIKNCKKYTIIYGDKETEEYVCNECYKILSPFVELAGGYIK